MKILLACFPLAFCCAALAQLAMEQKADISLRYWSAAIMADEFMRSNCGKREKINPLLADIARAKQEVKNKFPASMAIEIDETLDRTRETEMREFYRPIFKNAYPNKCKQAAEFFWIAHYDAMSRWNSFR